MPATDLKTATPIQKLQPDLIKLVKTLHEDLRQRSVEVPEVGAMLKAEYQQAWGAKRTQDTYQAWSGNYLNQVAVAWVLAAVFVRYLEDNELVDEHWLGGRLAEVREHYSAFFRAHPEWSDREYLQHIFDETTKLPGCEDLFGRDRNPLWLVGISGDGARALRDFFAEVEPATGLLARTFHGDTRFLGDLYQNLSEEAQKKYALLQTPDFVEEFILDRTLDPAIAEFGLAEVKMIDPTCGSGHFLLGAFHRLLAAWQQRAPHENQRVLARRALEAVHGVDINPFAVAIARFRLVIAFLQACGMSRLREAPAFKVHVATGDSLLHGNTLCSAKGWGVQELSNWLPDAFAAGDFEDAVEILSQHYHAVVGNPPYIVNRDKAHSSAIRAMYRTAYRQYSLAVPFKEKFWDLSIDAKGSQRAGFVGMITANSFMKREFGSRVIEEFLPLVDLTHVLDTSGAYIPGHGTPTVILLGRNRVPALDSVRAVLGIRGEPSTPEEPSQGQVWRSILDLVDQAGSQSPYVSVTDYPRAIFGQHPWSIGGGGAAELKERIESHATKLAALGVDIGRTAHTGDDDAFVLHASAALTLGLDPAVIPFVLGENVRDYTVSSGTVAIFPYSRQTLSADITVHVERFLWPLRPRLSNRRDFGQTILERGLTWYEYSMFFRERFKKLLSIAFPFVATHNHFVLDRGDKVFNRTAPIVKLPSTATEDDHLALLGLLNSSVACFWLKQVSNGKHMADGGEAHADPAYQRFEFDGSKLINFPIPEDHTRVMSKARSLDRLAQFISLLDPEKVFAHSTIWDLPNIETRAENFRLQMISVQEELDWLCYELYGLLDSAPLCQELQPLQLGERAFEIALARSEEDTTWFTRHNSTPIIELPEHWAPEYRATVEARLDVIANNPEIQLLEKPEHKRRWQQQPWNDRLHSALQQWLGDRIEAQVKQEHDLTSTDQIADRLSRDADFTQAVSLYLGRDEYDLTKEVTALAAPQSVAYLAALRYTEAGLLIRADWETTWELQRRQDAGENVGDIPVPPKYGQKDYARPEYWSLRGKLDVPKERFISYPGAEREADSSPVLGWAGWNHLQRAQALASYLVARREDDGWSTDRLIPHLAGLAELLPWLKQWHNDIDPESGERMGDYFDAFLGEQLRELGLSSKQLMDWRPTKSSGKKSRSLDKALRT